MKKKILLALFLSMFIYIGPAFAWSINDGDLIKASRPAVYFVWENKRFAFPNEQVFFSWFGGFGGVKTVSDAQLQSIPLSGNMTFRPGSQLIKIQTDPKVYALDQGNALRWVQTEDLARNLFGKDWSERVKDVSDALFVDYKIGQPIDNPETYDLKEVENLYYNNPSSMLYSRKLLSSNDKNYILPPQTTIKTHLINNGYSAESALGIDQLVSWYKGNLDDADLLFDGLINTQGSSMRLMNFGKSFGGSFKHFSVTLDSADGKQNVSYGEVLFPDGMMAYPRAALGGNFASNAYKTTYTFLSTDKPDDVVKWYRENGPKMGWVVDDYTIGNQYGGWKLGLKSSDDTKYLLLEWGTGSADVGTQFNVTYEVR